MDRLGASGNLTALTGGEMMPVPIAPIAVTAARFGAVALAGYMLARRMEGGRIDQRTEDALDDMPEGLTASRPTGRDQWNIGGRLRRVIRLGQFGPGLEIDASVLGRIRVRKA
jgi:hypothetical protein